MYNLNGIVIICLLNVVTSTAFFISAHFYTIGTSVNDTSLRFFLSLEGIFFISAIFKITRKVCEFE